MPQTGSEARVKILLSHNAYQQPGGEDAVFVAEAQLLAAKGHRILRYERHNDELNRLDVVDSISASINTVWSSTSYHTLLAFLERDKPDVAHFHNTFPLISPSAYYACADAGVPVVQTLHNYRLVCPAATFLRDGSVCESCLGRSVPWPGVAHACYRSSRSASAVVSAMLTVHRVKKTWNTKVDAYIALSEFARAKFIQGGLPPEKIRVKANFVSDPGAKSSAGDYAFYAGRLSEEKGLRILLSAWTRLNPTVPLHIAGDGPLHDEAVSEVESKRLKQVNFLGRVSAEEVLRWMRSARFLIAPSVCFENFPLSIAEAFACGVPVIASRLGAMQEIIEDGRTGLHFAAGDAEDLAAKIKWAWSHPEAMSEMGRVARKEYEAKYSPDQNYAALMDIYQQVCRSKVIS